MKAILEFDLPEESEEHKYAIDGYRFGDAIRAVDTRLRNMEKYDSKPNITVELARKMLREETSDCPWIWE